MPVDINALEEWTVGDRMLRDILHGMTPDQARQAEWRRGTLPPGQLGWRKATEIRDQAALLARAALQHRHDDPSAYDVDIDLGNRRLTGTVSPVFGDRLVSVTYSKLDGKHLLESWIPLLALIAHDPGRDWSAVCIGRPKRGTTPREEGLGRSRDDAVEVLRRAGGDLRRGPARADSVAHQDVLRLGGRPALRRRPDARGGVPVEVR